MLAKFFEADWSRTQRGGFVTVSDERQAVRMPKDQAGCRELKKGISNHGKPNGAVRLDS